jgi:hypothetical protein
MVTSYPSEKIEHFEYINFEIYVIKQHSNLTKNKKRNLLEINKKLIDKVDATCDQSMNEYFLFI